MTRRISAWAGPVIGIAAVLCAAIVVAYASGIRVAISVPVAADIGGQTPIGSNAATPRPLNTSALTLVHPTHPVEVLDGPDSSAETAEPSRSADEAATTASSHPTVTHEREDPATPDAAPSKSAVPSVAPTPSAHPQPTDSWSEGDPTRTPRPSSSGWRPTVTPSPSPSTSHRHSDDSTDDGTGGASQPGS